MTEQHEASKAPALAVEAEQGASQGAPAQLHDTQSSVPHNAPGSESSTESSVASTPESNAASQTPGAESAPAQAGAAESAASSTEGADEGSSEGTDEGEDGAEEGGEEGAASAADPQRKKRRRRRRKKPGAKDGVAAAGEGASGEGAPGEGAPSEGASSGGAASGGAASGGGGGGERRKQSHEKGERAPREGAGGVFARFFDGPNAGKRHAFSAGEVVAGRVVKINDGAFVVDLFGKATAFVDVFEPHEVPTAPEPPPPAAVEAPVQALATMVAEGGPATDPVVPVDGTDEAGIVTGEPATDAATPAAAIAESALGELPADGASQPEAQSVEAAVGDAIAAAEPAVEASYGHAVAESALGADDTAVASPEGEAKGSADGSTEAHAEAESEHHDDGGHDETEAEPEPEAPPAPDLGTIFRGRIGSVAESGHVVLVNRIVDVQTAKQRIVKAREQRQRVRGVVYGFNRGGFDVMVEGVRVFCPASGMALGPIENPEQQLGQRLEFTVPPAKAGTHGLVVSRRGILERQQRKAAKQLFRSLTPGQRLKGRVTQVREFGLFVDLGGFEGLVHSSELSFARGVRPQDVAQPGDEIDVQVLRVGEGQTRKERERVSLSMKTLQADPWSEHNELLEPGNIVTGKVVRTTEFGAFIELAPQIEGLLHISELGRELKHANQALEENQELRVIVERVDRKARRISLSKLSQAEEKALDAGVDSKSGRPPKPGAHLTVIVEKVEHAGLLVQIPGVFGKRGRGFIPNSEMGTERGTDHRRGFPPGTNVPVKVVGVDRDGGFRFSRKAVAFEEEKRAVQDYRREAARHGLGTFGDILRAKLEGSKQGS